MLWHEVFEIGLGKGGPSQNLEGLAGINALGRDVIIAGQAVGLKLAARNFARQLKSGGRHRDIKFCKILGIGAELFRDIAETTQAGWQVGQRLQAVFGDFGGKGQNGQGPFRRGVALQPKRLEPRIPVKIKNGLTHFLGNTACRLLRGEFGQNGLALDIRRKQFGKRGIGQGDKLRRSIRDISHALAGNWFGIAVVFIPVITVAI